MNDEAYMIASEGIPNLIDRMMEQGCDFDAAVEELKEQIDTAIANKDEYTGY